MPPSLCSFFIRAIIVIFSCSAAKDSIRFGLFLDEEQRNTAINWDVIEDNLRNDIELLPPDVIQVSRSQIFEAQGALCNYVANDNRTVAIFGPKDYLLSRTLQSACLHLGIPYFFSSWTPKTEPYPGNMFNLYPEADLFSIGISKIIESFDWNILSILYETNEGLLQLQDVLKLPKYNQRNIKNSITLYQLSPDWDDRSLLKNIKNSSANRIILDCQTSRILDVLRQAQEIELLTDFSTSFFLTSMDAHTLDYSSLKTLYNITTLRLFDTFNTNFRKRVDDYFPDTSPDTITVESVLIFDGMQLLTEAINQLKITINITPKFLYCPSDSYDDDLGLIKTIKQIQLKDPLTGPVWLPNGKREKFKLEVVEIVKLNKPIAIWDSENPEEIQLTRDATEIEAELKRRIENYNFIVVSREGRPYLYKRPEDEGYGNSRYYGYSVDLIKEIAKKINFTYEFRLTQDNSYTKIVSDLIERKADLGICDFTITPQRRELIDFSMPFMNLGIGILHKESSSEQVDNLYAFMRPISWTVWIYIWTLNLLISIAMFFVARLAPREWENPKPWDDQSKELENIWTIKNFLWLTLGSITCQGCDILPKSTPTRTIAGAWWLFSLIITSSYTANLAAFLTMSKKDITVDTVEELAAQSKIKYGLLSDGSTQAFFANSNHSLYQKMWNNMRNDKSVFEKNNDKGVERVVSTKNALYAFFMESTGIEFEMERKCELRKIGKLLDSKSYGIGMPLNADYRHHINSAILSLQETGKLLELKEKWWKKEREGEPCPRDNEEKSDSLALTNVGGIFIVLAVGISIAFVVAVLEFLWNIRRISVEEHISYWECFKAELLFASKIFTKKKRVKPICSESASDKSVTLSRDQLSLAKSMFNKSVSLLNLDNESMANVRRRNPVIEEENENSFDDD